MKSDGHFVRLGISTFVLVSAVLPYLGELIYLEVSLSLSIVFFVLLGFAWWHFFAANWSIANSSIIVFFFLFFYLAPVLQLRAIDESSAVFLVNTLRFDPSIAVIVNYCVATFLAAYWLCYVGLRRVTRIEQNDVDTEQPYIWPLSPAILLTAILLFLPLTSAYLLDGWQKIISLNLSESMEVDGIYRLLVAKVFALLPLLGVIVCLHLARRNKAYYLLCLFFLILLLIFKNPLFERRNAIGAVYLTLVASQFLWLNRSNLRSTLFGLFVMVVMFPLAGILTNVNYSRGLPVVENVSGVVSEHFTQLHYDAWANSQTIVEKVGNNGAAYGEQLVGVILFFVPRSLWPEKPIGTGKEVGAYLMDNYSMWFDNLSAPLPFEGYYDFGFMGVVAMAMILAAVVVGFEARIGKSPFDRLYYLFLSFSLYFILRGDLLASFAYTVGAFAGLVVLPNLLMFVQARMVYASKMGMVARHESID